MLLAKNGERLTASFQDISSLKNYQADLETTVQKLEATNKELEQYAYAASHDLQEPLRKINIFSSLLQERGHAQFDEKDNEYLNKIINATGRMTTLVTDLLSFSSLKKSDQFVPTNLNESLKSVLEDLDLVIQQKEAVINTDQFPIIEAIPLQMQQIFYNLVNNGLKFTRDNVPPEITISSRMLDQEEKLSDPRLNIEKEYLELKFQDNGIGFSNQYASQIFGLFKRLHSKDTYKGSGIGLALCQRVAENHHGFIYAKGDPGKGACFFVILPVKQS
jgi:light-regulated signal transduction histidine kinase (bacteriophytochrome)